ncbi:flavin reductase family protein [Hoeflea alexandrii]|uniref:flavin reductase family protein n=1 Tax=Hoeflea alexandrii TaxID=288436 RepID=UPI0022AFD49C|nr:flavin reductase family protein [Hoeflea alexandrii]MCZ4291018.1 flavin reductase family protein [Hoeflea alexandrii]
MATIDFSTLTPAERYKLMVASIVPRPVALVTTQGAEGCVNAAPFSFFNALCNDPPCVALGINWDEDAREKDTSVNIRTSGQFVVNLVDEALAPLMNLCELDLPAGESETALAGLDTSPSVQVAPPRITAAPFALECVLVQTVSLGPGRMIHIGRVVQMHLRDELFDAGRLRIHSERAGLIARMHGGGTYARTTDLFEMPRLSGEARRAALAGHPPAKAAGA